VLRKKFYTSSGFYFSERTLNVEIWDEKGARIYDHEIQML
jgi:hypothetical protein